MNIRSSRAALFTVVLSAGVATPMALMSSSPSAASAPRYHVSWAPCPGAPTTQCGTLRVPVDWAQPTGPTLSVAVARRPATDAAHRIGTLFYNPGGPGDGGVKYVEAAEVFFSATLRARFDIVSVDP